MQQTRVFISGFVQGVGYRQFIKYKARRLLINGFVKNLPDGRVEAIFQGAKDRTDQMILYCKKGSFLCKVDDVTVIVEEGEKQYTDFKIEKAEIT